MGAGLGTLLAMRAIPILLALGGTARADSGLLDRLQGAAPDLDPTVLSRALDSTRCARAAGELPSDGPPVLAVIDFSLPSTAQRLWVLDLERAELLMQTHVAHGQGTGDDLATTFSNRDGSHQSSLGLYRTAETYRGKHGYSLRLDGLEVGVNDRARQRAIVVHGAAYATQAFIQEHGRLGRSWGCPAVDEALSAELIDTIKGGAALFAWYPDEGWLEGSAWLGCGG